MFEQIKLPKLEDDQVRTANRLLEQLDQKERRNLLRASYYDGKRKARHVSTVVPPIYQRVAMVLGWSAKAVDALARRVTLEGFSWPDGDLGSLGSVEMWDDNYMRAEMNGAIVSKLTHGVSFLINTQGEPTEGEAKSLIHVRDARHATGTWNGRRRALDDLISVHRWDEDGRASDFTLYLDGVTVTAYKEAGEWKVDASDHPWGVPAEPLVYGYTPDRPFGRSRITRPVMAIHDAALRELPRLEAHLDVFAFPDYWLLGADETIFKNDDGSTKAAWQVAVARLRGIPDDLDAPDALARADVKQFSASSPEPHLAAINGFAKLFAREASLPDTAVAITDVSNPTSAESYDASQYELIAEAEGACDDNSRAVRRAWLRGLAIQNGLTSVPQEWKTIQDKWRDPRYLARSAQADAGLKQLTAAPELQGTELGYELLGFDERQIKLATSEQRRERGNELVQALRDAASGAAPTPNGEDAAAVKAKADALGALIRAGVSTESAAAQVGLAGLSFTGAVPVSLRMPEDAAAGLEDQ